MSNVNRCIEKPSEAIFADILGTYKTYFIWYVHLNLCWKSKHLSIHQDIHPFEV